MPGRCSEAKNKRKNTSTTGVGEDRKTRGEESSLMILRSDLGGGKRVKEGEKSLNLQLARQTTREKRFAPKGQQ